MGTTKYYKDEADSNRRMYRKYKTMFDKVNEELTKERDKVELLHIDCMASLNWRISKEQEIVLLKDKIRKLEEQ